MRVNESLRSNLRVLTEVNSRPFLRDSIFSAKFSCHDKVNESLCNNMKLLTQLNSKPFFFYLTQFFVLSLRVMRKLVSRYEIIWFLTQLN